MSIAPQKNERDWIFWTTIVIVFVLLVHNSTESLFIIAMAVLPVLIGVYFIKPSLIPMAVYLLIVGCIGRYTRYGRETYASDTLLAIKDYIGYFLAGKNVYAEIIMAQKGPTPFTYLPFSLFWYLPARLFTIDLRFYEMLVSNFVPVIFYAIGRAIKTWRHLPALAVIALTPFLLDLSADGSNDNSAIFLLLTAIFLHIIAQSKKQKKYAIMSAIFLGLAATFKHYVWFFVIFFIPYMLRQEGRVSISGRKYLYIFLLTAALVSLPFIVSSPDGFWRSLFFIEIGNFHTTWGWNIWVALSQSFQIVVSKESMWAVRTVTTAASIVVFFLLRKYTSLTYVLTAGIVSLLVYLFLSNWTTYAYFTFLVPLIGLATIGL